MGSEVKEFLLTVGTCLLSGAVGAAIVKSITDVRLWKLGKKERDQQKIESKDDTIKSLEGRVQATEDKVEFLLKEVHEYMEENKKLSTSIIYSNKLLMQDKIRTSSEVSIRKGSISYEQRKLLHDMWDAYHKDWHGNGDLNLIMELVDELPLDVK